ncbi:MAG: peptidyl-tRNA hydrolase [Candidatus Andersenbacteria bacterium]|nr:peptidyl-tRNA hydrolase [Candidatus Andersenbacteria bacterium]MBI3251014.1 peptidyl-tRNA hydrolase [Candidatus Andersenbacteria bacterium]
MIKLVVGLGNPGAKFERTRHNIGVRVVEAWAKGPGASMRTLYLLPADFMNNSGKVVAAAMKKHQVKMEELLLVHDDLETSFGEVRIKEIGSAKGHNGVRSIHEMLGTQEIRRLMVGVSRPPAEIPADRYVLSKFNSEEETLLAEKVIPEAVQKIQIILTPRPLPE